MIVVPARFTVAVKDCPVGFGSVVDVTKLTVNEVFVLAVIARGAKLYGAGAPEIEIRLPTAKLFVPEFVKVAVVPARTALTVRFGVRVSAAVLIGVAIETVKLLAATVVTTADETAGYGAFATPPFTVTKSPRAIV